MQITSRTRRRLAQGAIASLAIAVLGGCYVVPMQPTPATTASMAPAAPPAPPAPVTFTAHLYPSNPEASGYGMVAASVTNDLNGRGYFQTAIGGEAFAGEATRVAGSNREGVANGAGNRGSYLSCRYTMNSPTLGTGSCRMSNGAVFSMHIGS